MKEPRLGYQAGLSYAEISTQGDLSTDLIHTSAANRTFSFHGWFSVLHCYSFRIINLFLCSVFYAIHCNCHIIHPLSSRQTRLWHKKTSLLGGFCSANLSYASGLPPRKELRTAIIRFFIVFTKEIIPSGIKCVKRQILRHAQD